MAQSSYGGRTSDQIPISKTKQTGSSVGRLIRLKTWQDALDKSINDQPMATLAIAGIVGVHPRRALEIVVA